MLRDLSSTSRRHDGERTHRTLLELGRGISVHLRSMKRDCRPSRQPGVQGKLFRNMDVDELSVHPLMRRVHDVNLVSMMGFSL